LVGLATARGVPGVRGALDGVAVGAARVVGDDAAVGVALTPGRVGDGAVVAEGVAGVVRVGEGAVDPAGVVVGEGVGDRAGAVVGGDAVTVTRVVAAVAVAVRVDVGANEAVGAGGEAVAVALVVLAAATTIVTGTRSSPPLVSTCRAPV